MNTLQSLGMWLPTILSAIEDEEWTLGIGDPTVGGWVTVAVYIVTAGVCAAATIRAFTFSRAVDKHRALVFFGTLTLAMLVLGINKQLDLQTLITIYGKRMAISQGWYNDRRIVQAIFIVAVIILFGGGLALFAYALRRTWRRHAVTLAGLAMLSAFIVIRAASFHHVDVMLGVHLAGLKINIIIENMALFIILGGVVYAGLILSPNAERKQAYIKVQDDEIAKEARRRRAEFQKMRMQRREERATKHGPDQ